MFKPRLGMSWMLDLLIEKSLFVRHRCESTLLDLYITYSFLRCSAVWGGKQGNILYFSSRWDFTHEGFETQFCSISASDHWPDSAPNNPNNWRSNPDLSTCSSREPGTTSAGESISFFYRDLIFTTTIYWSGAHPASQPEPEQPDDSNPGRHPEWSECDHDGSQQVYIRGYGQYKHS